MYHSLSPVREADPLIGAVIGLASEQKLSTLSARTLGERAGVAASAVNYRYGSLAALIDAARHEADTICAAYWADQARRLEDLPLAEGDFAPLAFTTIQSIIRLHRGEERLLWQSRIEAARAGEMSGLFASATAERQFWGSLLEGCGMTSLLPGTLQSFASAIRFAYLAFPELSAFDSWALALLQRFTDRSQARAVSDTDSAVRLAAETAARHAESDTVPDHDTARRILGAAAALVMEQGAEAATHRAVAARAELSVSSVQHFFGTRRSILLAAFRAIYEQTRARTVPELPGNATLSPDQLLGLLDARLDTSPGDIRREFAAMNGLILSASEDEDSRVIAHGLIARQGAASMQLLAALRNFRGTPSRLDAQILSMVMSHHVWCDTPDDASSEGGKDSKDNDVGRNLIECLFV